MIPLVRKIALCCTFCLFTAGAVAASAANMLLLGAAHSNAGIVAVGERGSILVSTDEGESWRQVAAPTTATLTALSFAPDGERGWAVGHDAIILQTQDGGRTWTQSWQGENLEDSFLDVCAVDATTVLAVGAYGFAMRSNDAGESWHPFSPQDDDSHLNRLTRAPDGRLYLAGERGTLLRSEDAGETWDPVPTPYDGSFYGVLPLQSSALLAHGLRGHAYRSEDDGESWSPVETNSESLLACAMETRTGTVLLAGQARTLLQSKDDAQRFAAPSAVPAPATAFLVETSAGRVLAFGEGGARFLTLANDE